MKLLSENEKSANRAASNVMRITAVMAVVVLLLDIFGIFAVDLPVMITAVSAAVVLLFIPTLLVNVLKKNGPAVKYVIVVCAVLFTMIMAVTLSYHAVLLYVYPIAIASLYFSAKLGTITTILTGVAVSAGQILAFYCDFVTDHNGDTLKRVLIYGVLPRLLILICIAAIFTMLCRRTASMLGSLMSAEQQEEIREKSLNVSRALLSTVTELDRISEGSAKASHCAAEESRTVMQDSEINSENIRDVDDSMNRISESLEKLSEMSGKISELTQKADEITAENDEMISRAYNGMDEICRSTEESMALISKLSEQSEQIVGIAKVIADISMQTNILALNASVEAAHAGERGKGFAVVATEIRKLSGETNTAAAEIGEVIKNVTENIAGTVKAMEKNSALTRESMEVMEQVKVSAEHISVSNSGITSHITDMNEVIGSAVQRGTNVSEKLTKVSAGIVDNSRAVRHMAEVIEENSSGAESLGLMIKNIGSMAQELEGLTAN